MNEYNTVKQSPLAGLAAYGGGSGSTLFGRKGVDGYEIQRSLRFNSADSANLSRTPSSASSRRTWTWAGWVKRSALGATQGRIFGGGTSDYFDLYFPSGDELRVLWTGNNLTTTTALFRDPTAWYHIVLAVDTTQSTAADRIKIYVNGTLQARSSTNPSQNYDTAVNNTVLHTIGRYAGSTGTTYFNGYLADVYFVDGQALSPSSFGVTNSDGVWDPKEFTGSFGTNGFHLDFADPADLGDDNSGNGNDWTPNNLVGSAPGLLTADQGFGVVTYTGNGSSQTLSSLAFQPDLVWIKRRDADGRNMLFNSISGATKGLHTDHTAAEFTDSATLTGFTSSGFSVGSHALANANNGTYVAWCWKGGGSAVSNTDGSVTSSVSANTTYGLSVVSFTVGTAPYTVGHGLGAVPKMIILKSRSGTTNWVVYHESTGNQSRTYLNLTNAASSGENYLNSTSPTSSVFTLASSGEFSGNMLAYCWSEISGFSKFSSYTGSGSSGNKVTTGFKPKWVMVKRTTNISGSHMGWVIIDSERGHNKRLSAQSLQEENDGPINAASSPNDDITFQEDGFTLASGASATNGNGETYIFAAYADKPDPPDIDSLIDTPTNYDASSGNNGGNYATLNPLDSTLGSNLTNGNQDAAGSSSWSTAHARGTFGLTSGKWFWEVTRTGGSGANAMIGFGNKAYSLTESFSSTPANGWLFNFANGTEILRPSGGGSGYFSGSAMGVGDTVGIALDMDAKTAVFYKNGTAGASISLSSTKTGSTDNIDELFPVVGVYNANVAFNGGQRPFSQTVPTGYSSLCTQNLPDPAIADGSTYFDALTYTGSSSPQTVSGLNFASDLIWIKSRSHTGWHILQDSIRSFGKTLFSNSTNAEIGNANDLISNVTATGFSVNTNYNSGSDTATTTTSGSNNYVTWAWNAGANSDKTYTVKVVSDSGNKYRFDDFGTSAVTLDLSEGSTYVFDQSDNTNAGHPLRFSTTANGTHGGGSEYTTGVTVTGTPGQAGAKTTIVVAASAPTLYYYCSVHSGMGGQANTNSTAGASNFNGSVQATVKANQTAGFSIVTGSGNSGTYGHGLNAKPDLVIVKQRNNAVAWAVAHSALGAMKDNIIYLNGSNANTNSSNFWGSSNFDSSVFPVSSNICTSGATFVAYCFTSVAGYSAFGSYTGNGSADGPFINIGFRPKFILLKRSDADNYNWNIHDASRDADNVVSARIFPNTDATESTNIALLDFTSNGVKLRTTDTVWNASGGTYIYACFSEHPFKNARAR